MTLDDYIERRNAIQLKAEDKGEAIAQQCWADMSVASRHIERIIAGSLSLVPMVEREIARSLDEAEANLRRAVE